MCAPDEFHRSTLLITAGRAWPAQHRWNIGAVIAAPMEHWCRCGPAADAGRRSAVRLGGLLLNGRCSTGAVRAPLEESSTGPPVWSARVHPDLAGCSLARGRYRRLLPARPRPDRGLRQRPGLTLAP